MKKGLTALCHKFFINLSNPTRLAALEKLMEQPMSVNELADVLGQEQSMVSHNLKRVYSVNRETVGALFKVIENHAEKFCPTGGECLMEESKIW
jgi:DNA-binding transcriptional ArsR family regulator